MKLVALALGVWLFSNSIHVLKFRNKIKKK
nr:MAG TPA: CAP18-binding protein [Caudoviricetes sp.]